MHWGWRSRWVGAIPAVYALVVRFGLPESVRFLESQGRHDEAEAAVRQFEEAAGVSVDERDKAPDAAATAAAKVTTLFTEPGSMASVTALLPVSFGLWPGA